MQINQDSKKQTQNLTSEKEDSKPNSESKCRKSRFKETKLNNLNAGKSRFRN
nr:hypothetical protein [Mycoplasmopsis bovis]